MKKTKIILTAICFMVSLTTIATSWDEPWQDEIIKQADYFVLAQVKSFKEKKGVKIKIIKTLGGEQLEGQIKITNFYLLDLCSFSGGHGPEFHFEKTKNCYFFIKKNAKGEYCIATPTSGFADILNGKVYATYRHSYHQTKVSADVYETTMTAIFNHYHNLSFDKKSVAEYIDKYLPSKPAGFGDSEIDTFFAQHAALESIYHLRLEGYYEEILPFLKDTLNFHNQVSAARALVAYNTKKCKRELFTVIADSTSDNFVQVMCIWTLKEFKPTELKPQLAAVQSTASTATIGFGGNIMDPRICTHIPTVKDALLKLLEQL